MELRIAMDGQEALDIIAAAEKDLGAVRPHLVLLDLNLPKVDGFEVLRRLRASEQFKHIPALVVSSSDAPVDRAMAHRLGAQYFLKPASYVEYMKIGAVLRHLLGSSSE